MYKNLLRRCKIMIIAAVFFFLLIGIAMLAFPGGNLIDTSSIHYNFFLNTLSDLGNSITISGKTNTVSKIMYITAFGGLGIVMIYFSRIWWALGTDVLEKKFAGYTSKICMIISGLAFIGIAFTPLSSFFDQHMLYLSIAFLAYTLWIIFILILQFSNEKLRKLFLFNVINLLIMLYYVFVIYHFEKPDAEDEFEFYAVSQMVAVMSIIVNLFYQSVGIMHYLKTSDFRRSGFKNFYV
ncbi:MAG TPA: hypothetical protein PL089_11200 [Ignavibacteria bacterium]|nr:hypothetical protein [Ignavibacteria bacterium]